MTVAFITLFICLYVAAGQVNGRTFKLGLLCPKSHIRLGWDITVAAAYKAINKAHDDGILTEHEIQIVYRNDQCNNKYGAGMTVELRDEEDVDAYLGPPCSTSTKVAGLLAAFWNRPMFTHGATDPMISDKNLFSTVVRVAPAFTKMSAGVAALVKYFGWKRVVMISSRAVGVRDVFCDYAARSIEETLRGSDIYLAEWVIFNSGINGREMDDMLERISQRGRIVLMCAKKEDEHNILLAAQERGLTNAEYLYISLDHIPPDDIRTPWAGISEKNKPREAQLFEAYRSVLQVSLASVNSREAIAFKNNIPQWMAEAPTFYNETLLSGKKASTYALFLHDIVYLYMLVVEDTLNKTQDPRDGAVMFENAKHKQFEGITGHVVIDSNGDRDPNYWVYYLNTEDKIYDVWTEIKLIKPPDERVSIDTPGRWLTADGKPPPDIPICGYLGEKCTSGRDAAIGGGVGASAVVIIALVVGYIIYKRRKMEEELRNMLWRIKPDDVNLLADTNKSMSINSQMSICSMAAMSTDKMSQISEGQTGTKFGQNKAIYKGAVVMMQPINKDQIQLTREDHLELNAMRQMTHDNVNTFVGACIDPPTSAILMAFCSRGSLQDILNNEEIKLDWMFKVSLNMDIISGLQYLHSSLLKSHGFLTSDKCYVDNRWVVKISSFGVQRLRQHGADDKDVEDYKMTRELLWTAPEMLRLPAYEIPRNGTPRADVYSYGIICKEIVYRDLPYDTSEMTMEDIIEKVRAGPAEGESPFRPALSDRLEEGNDPEINNLITACWAEDPGDRPSLSGIRKSLKTFNKGKKINIMDNMLSMMEKYANNLEEIVQQRTSELVEEKKKTDMLLYSMLPRTVADQLKSAGAVEPESFDECTIFFSDIVGFTALSSESTPLQVVVLLNDLYTLFDGIIAMHDVYKVETIGDAYMVVSGIPLRNGNIHVGEISTMALDLLNGVTTKFIIRHRPDKKLRLRIGLHTGPCVTGVVGLKMPRYCLFGDTVNMASRMESNGEALKIHMSQDSYAALQILGGYITKCRGEMAIKGKGMQKTYWLLGKEGYTKELPPFEEK